MGVKNRPIRFGDLPTPRQGGAEPLEEATNILPAATAAPPPRQLQWVSTVLDQSAVTPGAIINVAWKAPFNAVPTGYAVQWAKNILFTNAQTATATGLSAALRVQTKTRYYVRVAAMYGDLRSDWTDQVNDVSADDTIPPDPPTSLSATFVGTGDLRISWTNPTSENFRDIELSIYTDSGKTTLLEQVFDATGQYVWTVQQNLARTSNAGDPSIYVELRSRSWANVYSTAVNASTTKSAPSTPGSASATWDGASGTCTFAWSAVSDAAVYRLTIDGVAHDLVDTRFAYTLGQNRQEHSGTADPTLTWSLVAVDGLKQSSSVTSGTATLAPPATPSSVASDFTGPDAIWTWASQSGVTGYRITIDSIARDTTATRYVYPFALNIQEHTGTPDPSLTYSLVAVDALGQTSTTPASGTATNPVPANVTSASILAGANQIAVFITATTPSDFQQFRVDIYRDSALVDTIYTRVPLANYPTNTAGSYQAKVRMVDVFNQLSVATADTATVTLDPLTIAYLRAGTTYSDDVGNSASTLAVLKDDVRVTTGVTYSPP